jgi:hypothetical protein
VIEGSDHSRCCSLRVQFMTQREIVEKYSTRKWDVFTAKILIEFFPYKIVFVHENKQPDYVGRINFSSWLLQFVKTQLPFIMDEAWFYLGDCVDMQNI